MTLKEREANEIGEALRGKRSNNKNLTLDDASDTYEFYMNHLVDYASLILEEPDNSGDKKTKTLKLATISEQKNETDKKLKIVRKQMGQVSESDKLETKDKKPFLKRKSESTSFLEDNQNEAER